MGQESNTRPEDQYRTLFDYLPDGILIADHGSYYLDANASMCAMLGYAHAELVGKHATDIVVPAQVARTTRASGSSGARTARCSLPRSASP